MQKVFIAVLISLVIAGCDQGSKNSVSRERTSGVQSEALPVIVNVPEIAAKSDEKVAEILGSPSACESIKYGTKCSYRSGSIEIVFINEKADWITLYISDDVPYSSDALPRFGMKKRPASFGNDFLMRWDGIDGLLEVSLFPVHGRVDYAYIKATTK